MAEMDMKEKLVELAKPVLTSLPFPWCTVWRDVAEKIAGFTGSNSLRR